MNQETKCTRCGNMESGAHACKPLVKNQCDGCQRGLLIKDGIHIRDDKVGNHIVMGCTKERYTPEVSENKECPCDGGKAVISKHLETCIFWTPESYNSSPSEKVEVSEWEKNIQKWKQENPEVRHDISDWVSFIKKVVYDTRNQTLEEAAEALEKNKAITKKQIPNYNDAVIEACNSKDIDKLIFLWGHSLCDECNDTVSAAQSTIRALKK